LAVAGTHGKTTTSSILTHIFYKSNQSFTSIMGGFFNNNSSNLIKTGSDAIIVEADEYDRSFLHLNPTIACITSIEADHLDIYKTQDFYKDAFFQFSKQVSNKLIVAHGLPISGLTYGIEVPADYKGFNIQIIENGYRFDLKTPNGNFKNIFFNQIGIHNLSNAIGAIAMADQAGINMNKTLLALKSFPGVYRRMNLYKWRDAYIIDDYAHHPSEINSVFETIKAFYPKQKNCVVFQPHLYSRTSDFMDDFINVLNKFDEIRLIDIYPAREKPIQGVNVEILLEGISNKKAKYIQKNQVKNELKNSDATIFALLGAGDIGEVIKQFKDESVII
jgi:UDP-N-acetylmuramate--alanine ligase